MVQEVASHFLHHGEIGDETILSTPFGASFRSKAASRWPIMRNVRDFGS